MNLFRARGFKHTSFADLVDELGIGRQSLYDTFGDKQTLYQAALQRYTRRLLDHVRDVLAAPGTVREVFQRLLEDVIADNTAGAAPGCFMVNSIIELMPHDADTRAAAQSYAREIEGLLIARLVAAQRAGELSRKQDPVALARYFYHTLLGIAVAARALGDKAALRQTAALALKGLG